MKNRPVRGDSASFKIQTVNKVLKNKKIEYLKEEFYKSKISEGSEFMYGYKHFLNPDPHKGFDKGFYETLIGDNTKAQLASYYRTLEIGEFKNGKLDGYGARYLYNETSNQGEEFENARTIGMIGKYEKGLPNRKILFYVLTNDGDRQDALTIWHKGMLLKHQKDYEEKNFNVSDEIVSSIFFEPTDYDREKWWKEYKNEFLE